jgi:5-methyltetrahydrofolate--homocysteine methyltransferase
MTGLRLMNQIMDPLEREAVLASHRNSKEGAFGEPSFTEPPAPVSEDRSPKVRVDFPILPAPYLDRKIRDVPQLAELWSYINPFMLFGRHLGYKGNFDKDLADGVPKAIELNAMVNELKCEAARVLKVKAVWQFFEAERRRGGAAAHVSLRTPAAARRSVSERLHSAGEGWPARPSGDLRGHSRRGSS